jgi:hypothetical protein
MKSLVLKLRSIQEQHCAIIFFAAAEHIHNHPDNTASATQSLLMRAKHCTATEGGHFEQLL